jgi:hypothetical protein
MPDVEQNRESVRAKDSRLSIQSGTDFPSLDFHGIEQQSLSDIALCQALVFVLRDRKQFETLWVRRDLSIS